MANEDERKAAQRQASPVPTRAEVAVEEPNQVLGSSVLLLVLGVAPRAASKNVQITTLEDITPQRSPQKPA
jgi:hypothetical protein